MTHPRKTKENYERNEIDYYFDGDDLIAEVQGANILAYYTQGQGLLSQRRNNASYFYHYDGLGSTKALTDANQNIQNTTKYDAWGNILQAGGSIFNSFLYSGASGFYWEEETQLYIINPLYDPVRGRIISLPEVRNIDWEGGGYRKWPYWPPGSKDPGKLPLVPQPGTCQEKAWNIYVLCLRKKYKDCNDACTCEVEAELEMKAWESGYSFPPSSPQLLPSPENPLAYFYMVTYIGKLHDSCVNQCMNKSGEFFFHKVIRVGRTKYMLITPPPTIYLENCFQKARDFYKKCVGK